MSPEAKRTVAAVVALTAIAFGLYANTLSSPFVFDDGPSIVDNPNIEALWPLTRSMDAPPGAGSSGRPLVSLSLALNYALGGRAVLGYHLFNIATLALGALALFGLGRRVLAHAGVAAHTGLAFTLALLWMVHPLHTDTLNHVVYRNESMMALFYLLSLYACVRAFEEVARLRWTLLGVLAAAAAMASKEVAVSLPLAVLALDRQFWSPSFRVALARRKALYVGLAATWIVLALCVLSGDRGDSVGYGHVEIINATDYLRTQMVALTTYLRLTLLGDDFVFDYHSQEVVRSWGTVWFESSLLALAFGAGLWAFVRRYIAGFLGLAFFVLLAPTSSVIPLAGELIAEHRMYLPLAPLIALAMFAIHGAAQHTLATRKWLAPLFVVLAASPLAWSTVVRNRDYESQTTLWQDTVAKRPLNSRAWSHLATALKNEGRIEEAERAYLRTLELDPRDGKASFNYGNVLFERGDLQAALERYRVAAEFNGDNENIRFNFGYALISSGQLKQGVEEYRAALAIDPNFERAKMLLAWLLATAPEDSLRNGAEAVRLARELNEATGYRLPRYLDTLAAALAENGEFEAAQEMAQRGATTARALGNARVASEIEARRRLYASRQPFRAG